MGTTIRELRERLQGPRRPYDTFYGKNVMRRFSIYITFLLSKTPVSPIFITVLSIFCGLAGAYLLWERYWLAGILLVNGWYLLDHVDGEVARLKGMSSATGLFLDSLANAIVQPLTFFAIAGGSLTGAAAAYGSLMMLMIPCTSAETVRSLSMKPVEHPDKRPATATPQPILKKCFSCFHTLMTFPVLLPLATILIAFLNFWTPATLEAIMRQTVLAYATLINFLWIAILTNMILVRKLDKNYSTNP